MADSIRQQIVTAVLAGLATITTANGYETNLGSKVFEWRDLDAQPFDPSELANACGTVEDGDETNDQKFIGQGANNRHEKLLNFTLKFATLANNPTPAAQARRVIADVQKLILNNRKWSNLALDTSPVSVITNLDVKQAAKIYSGAQIRFAVRYQHKAFDAYTQ